MKRSMVAVLAAVCMFAWGNAFAQDGLSDVSGFKINAAGTLIMQGTDKVNAPSSKDAKNNATYSIDLEIEKEFGNGGKAFMHLEAGRGDGVNAYIGSFAGVNADANHTSDGVAVTELWYEQMLLNDKFAVTFGKLNPASYLDENEYANDENTQFVNPVFVNNAVIGFTENNLGLRMTYSPSEKFDLTYAYMTSGEDWETIDCDGFNAFQVNFKPAESANYRAMFWASNRESEKFSGGDKKGGYGFALSLDQKLNDNVGVFARFGYSDPSVYRLSMSWSAGAQFGGSMWTRENDTAGIALGQLMQSSDFTDANPVKKDNETQTEMYYSFALNENFFITPSVQYISKPEGGNTANDDAFVYGIRTHVSF